ncbi:MAG: flavodoxin family protein, partial [Clostridium sp.]
PVYFYDITGEMRSFLERLLFPSLPYAKDAISEGTYFPKKLKTAFIYTMGAPDDTYKDEVLGKIKPMEDFISQIFRLPVKTLYSNNAYQFDDYSKYEASVFDLEDKIKQRDEVFPIDCEKAFSLGVDLALDKS